MNKKVMGVCFIGLIIIVTFFLILRLPKNLSNEEDSAIYDLTIEEVTNINQNSNLLGCVLLSEAPNDAMPQETIDIGDGKDSFACDSYNGNFVVNQVFIASEEGNVLGIFVNDDLEKVIRIMETQGYSLYDKQIPSHQIFVKHHVSFNIEFSEENRVIEISVSVFDPAVEGIIY